MDWEGHLGHPDPEVDAVIVAICDFRKGSKTRSEMLGVIRNLFANGSAAAKKEYENVFNDVQNGRDRKHAQERAKLAIRRKQQELYKPFVMLQRRNRNNPTLDEVQELMEEAAELEKQGLSTNGASVGSWQWQDTKDYAGNEHAIVEADGRTLYEGPIEAEFGVEFTEYARASFSNGEFRVSYSVFENRLLEGDGLWRYVENPEYAEVVQRNWDASQADLGEVEHQPLPEPVYPLVPVDGVIPYKAEPVVVTHQAKTFATIEQMFAFLEDISAEDYTPNLNL